MSLLDYVRIYQCDPARAARVLTEAQGLTDWQQHGWYSPQTRQTHSEPTKELFVRYLHDHLSLMSDCRAWVTEALQAYAKDVPMPAVITGVSNPRLNKYPTGTMMRRHADHIHSLFDGDTKGIPALSLVALLNDDFEGGRFIVRDQELDLKAGDILVFPSCFLYPHEVTEVTAGERLSFVSWAW
jgi:predicted 2-oxoglutarate/Fe(II)-dependent dioxygenase YbiX